MKAPILLTSCNSPNQDGICLLEPGVLRSGAAGSEVQATTFESYAKTIFDTILGAVILLSILMIVFGGVQYAASAVPGAKGDAKNRIWGAIWGLVLALAAWLILQEINPDLVTGWNIFK